MAKPLFAFLSDIQPCLHYGFRAHYPAVGSTRNAIGTGAVVLLSSTTKSTLESMGAGHKVTSSGVRDAANPENSTTYQVASFCTLENIMEFKMDPPRNRSARRACAIISSMLDDAFIVEKMECVEPSDVDSAIHIFQKLRRLSMKLEPDNKEK